MVAPAIANLEPRKDNGRRSGCLQPRKLGEEPKRSWATAEGFAAFAHEEDVDVRRQLSEACEEHVDLAVEQGDVEDGHRSVDAFIS
jgi:hypothetical protein